MTFVKTSTNNGSILERIKFNKVLSGVALSTVITLSASVLWHQLFFENEYDSIGFGSTSTADQIISLQIFAALTQNFVLCLSYAVAKLISKSSNSLQFLPTWVIPLLGFYHWSYHVVGRAASSTNAAMAINSKLSRFESIAMFLLIESVFEVIHFTLVGSVAGFTIGV